MNFAFFESLSPRDAKRFLDNFLEAEKTGLKDLVGPVKLSGISLDFTIRSIAPFFVWAVGTMKTVARPPDPSLPPWILETPSYAPGLFDLTPGSTVTALRTAYYLGETFVRTHPMLRWKTGNRRFAQQNQPVVGTFKAGMELPVLLVTENLVRGMIKGEPVATVEKAVAKWESLVL